jgi:MFS family permease
MTRTERTYYLVFGLYNLSWSLLGPLYALFLLSRGLDLFAINLVFAAYMVTAFLFEVPTGAVADVFGRKVSFVLSCAVRALAFAMYPFCDGVLQFMVAESIDAIGTTLASGALDAWAVDGMRAEGDRRPTDRFFARAHLLSRVLMIGAGVVCGYVAERSMTVPWFLGASGFTLTGTVGLLFMWRDRPEGVTSVSPVTGVVRTLQQGVQTVRVVPVLRLMCVLTVLASAAAMPVHHLWPPRMQGLAGGAVWVVGWIWAAWHLTALVGSALVPRLLGRFARERVLCGAMLWRAVTLALAALSATFYPAVAGLLLWEMGFGVSEPVLQAWMNEHAPPSERATVLSVRSMSFTLGGAAGLLALGLLARAAGIPAAWVVAALLLAAAAAGCLRLGRAARRSLAPACAPLPATGTGP